MSQTGPWSVKGIDQRARDAAREAAQAEGITLGEYLNRLLMSVDAPRPNEVSYPFANRRPSQGAANDTLDKLTRRIEATEARSTLAITGLDHTILGLVAKLEASEESVATISDKVETFIDELRDTYSALQSKVQKLEADDSARENLDALKALEQALGKLASHVFEESELAQNETQAVKGRVETGFAELTERVEQMEVKVERTHSEARSRADEAARDLADRISDLETHTNLRLTEIDKTEKRIDDVEAKASKASASVEEMLAETQDRLNRAESTTDSALKSLQSNFESLDTKIESLTSSVDPDLANKLRDEFEARFNDVMETVRTTIEATRAELAEQIAQAAAGSQDADVSALQSDLSKLEQSVSEERQRQSKDVQSVAAEIKRIGGHVADQLEAFDERLDTRVSASEHRTAEAISQIGDQVAGITNRMQSKHDKAIETLTADIAENRKRAEASLDEVLHSVSDRLDSMQSKTLSSLSPIQKAMASLATRLESLEDSIRIDDPGQEDVRPVELAVDMSETDRLLEEYQEAAESSELIADEYDADFEPGLPSETNTSDEEFSFLEDISETIEPVDADASDIDFEEAAGIDTISSPYTEDFDVIEDDTPELAASPDIDEPGEEFTPDEFALEPEPMEQSALSDLDDLDDGHTEARDSDIFEDDEFDYSSDGAEADTESVSDMLDDEELAPDYSEPEPDYISMARKAAIAASSGKQNRAPARTHGANRSPMSGRLPLYAAASAVVITGATVGGYLYLRGKQAAAPVATPAGAAAATSENAEAAPSTADLVPTEAQSALDVSAPGLVDPLTEEDASAPQLQEAEVAEPTSISLQSATLETRPEYAPVPPLETLSDAANSGNGVAKYQLAQQTLSEGRLQQGAQLMKQSAEQGVPAAQYILSKLHERGTGVPKDLTLARQWTERAARGGNVKAMHDLAVFMAEGEGGEQSYAGAVEWFRKGAEYGIVDSQYNLGVLYEQGLGISPNLTEALYWFMIAEKNGDAGAPEKIMDLTDRVSPEAVALARQQANDWKPSQANGAANGRFGPQSWELGNPRQVIAIQMALSAMAYDIGAPDGSIGPQTTEAIKSYERDSGLPVTGQVTQALIDSLNNRLVN